jgi:hypothetical protein
MVVVVAIGVSFPIGVVAVVIGVSVSIVVVAVVIGVSVVMGVSVAIGVSVSPGVVPGVTVSLPAGCTHPAIMMLAITMRARIPNMLFMWWTMLLGVNKLFSLPEN